MKCYESRRDLRLHLDETCATMIKSLRNLEELMYDDYDLDYTFCNDHSYDLDEYYDNLDEDYARDSHDYQDLAYRHYA
jgi:hypothetical protein